MSVIGEFIEIGYSEYKDNEVKKQNRDLAKQYDKQIFMLTKSIEGIEEFSEGLVEMEREGSELRSQDIFRKITSEISWEQIWHIAGQWKRGLEERGKR